MAEFYEQALLIKGVYLDVDACSLLHYNSLKIQFSHRAENMITENRIMKWIEGEC